MVTRARLRTILLGRGGEDKSWMLNPAVFIFALGITGESPRYATPPTSCHNPNRQDIGNEMNFLLVYFSVFILFSKNSDLQHQQKISPWGFAVVLRLCVTYIINIWPLVPNHQTHVAFVTPDSTVNPKGCNNRAGY